jgi:hypothetical protein
MPEVKITLKTLGSSSQGNAVLGEPEMDALDRARHCFRKGRLEFMGGPIVYEQGNGIPGYENNERHMRYAPQSVLQDPEAEKLQVDVTEQ